MSEHMMKHASYLYLIFIVVISCFININNGLETINPLTTSSTNSDVATIVTEVITSNGIETLTSSPESNLSEVTSAPVVQSTALVNISSTEGTSRQSSISNEESESETIVTELALNIGLTTPDYDVSMGGDNVEGTDTQVSNKTEISFLSETAIPEPTELITVDILATEQIGLTTSFAIMTASSQPIETGFDPLVTTHPSLTLVVREITTQLQSEELPSASVAMTPDNSDATDITEFETEIGTIYIDDAGLVTMPVGKTTESDTITTAGVVGVTNGTNVMVTNKDITTDLNNDGLITTVNYDGMVSAGKTTWLEEDLMTTMLDVDTTAQPDVGSTLLAVIGSTVVPDVDTTAVPYAGTTALPDEGTTVMPDEGTTALQYAGTTVVPDEGTTVMPDEGTTALQYAGTTVVPDEGTTALQYAGTTVVSDEGTTVVPDIGSTLLVVIGSTVIPDAGTTAVQDAGTTAVQDAGTTAVPDAGMTSLPDAGTTALPDAGTTAVPDIGSTLLAVISSTVIPDEGTAAMPDASTTAVPDAGTTAVPDAGTTAVPDAGTTAVPDAGTTAVPDADTTAVPDADTTAVPDADTTAVPDADTTASMNVATSLHSASPPSINTVAPLTQENLQTTLPVQVQGTTSTIDAVTKKPAAVIKEEDLTDAQKTESVVVAVFETMTRTTWYNEKDFKFRQFIASVANDTPTRRRRRQASGTVTAEDVLYIDPSPLEIDGSLKLHFVVQSGSSFVSAKTMITDLNKPANQARLKEEVDVVIYQLSAGIGQVVKSEPNESTGFVDNHTGLFVTIIVVACLSILFIVMGLLHSICDRRRGRRGEYITSNSSDIESGYDNPIMDEKSGSNGNNAHLISIKVDTAMVPMEEQSNSLQGKFEVEDTHL